MFLLIIFKIIGYKNASKFGSLIGRSIGKFVKSDKIILKNLSIINSFTNLKIEDKSLFTREVFSNYGRILSDYVYLSDFRNGPLKNYVNIKGIEYLEEIKLKNKKVVFISGHFNNFELMAMFIDAAGINVSAIYRPLNNVFLNKIMEFIRLKYICKNQIKKGKKGTRQILNFLKKNFSVALMIDQRVSEGVRVNFFGKQAYTTTIPAQIAKKFGCEIVPIYIERYDDIKFNLVINQPIKFDDKKSITEISLELNKILENMILKNPSQWIFTHNRWK